MGRFTIASVILLLITNAIVLGGVAYNRTGTPVASIKLTERELPIHHSYGFADENSGMSLQLKWNVLDLDKDLQYLHRSYNTPAWLDDAKLIELGFEIDELKIDTNHYEFRVYKLEREAILVLEYDGAAYQQALEIAEIKAEKLRNELDSSPDNERLGDSLQSFERNLDRLKVAQSRLYVIDSGRDRQALMQDYADHDNVIFAKGIIGLRWNKGELEGFIRRMSVEQVHVPLPLSDQLDKISPQRILYTRHAIREEPPRYQVQLNIGKRLEPWVESVMLLEP